MPEPAPLNRHSGPGGADAAEASQGLLTAAIAREDAERDRLAAALHGVDLATLHGDAARIAFWANVYKRCCCTRAPGARSRAACCATGGSSARRPTRSPASGGRWT